MFINPQTTVFTDPHLDITDKLRRVNLVYALLVCILACTGFSALYSAAGGSFEPWALRQMVRFVFGLFGMIIVALIDIRVWFRLAYVIYGAVFFLLLVVEIKGHVGMGAQRWINLGFIQIQPSELMKIAVILVLARFFHGAGLEQVRRPLFLLKPLVFVLLPVGLVLVQPDLGTAMKILMGSAVMFFLAGVSWKIFTLAGAAGLAAIPVGWHFLRDYQKERVLTFLNPERDPLGAGYHITQSKIALGSGGVSGKGYLQGSQSHLDFLPEKQTDFIFTLFAEEWGLLGGFFLIFLCMAIIAYGFAIALSCHNQFGRLLALGITTNFALYVFINIGMVTGLMPVVGIPLPLMSYGGTAMLAVLFGFGLVQSVYIHKELKLTRRV